MAEIRVEPRKKGRGWLWLVVLLIVIAAVLYYLYASGMLGGGAGTTTTPPAPAPTTPAPTSMLHGAPAWLASAPDILTSPITGGGYGTA